MKRNHLFASAAIGAVLVATLPVDAQMLGGGMRGGVSGMQTARFGGGFGPMHSAATSQTDPSASARAGGRVDGLGRVDRTAKTGTQEAKTNAVAAGRGAASAGKFEATKASDTALDRTRAAAGSTAVAGGLSTTEGSGAKAATGTATPSASEPPKPERAGRPPHSSTAPAPQPKSDGASDGAETPRSTSSQGEVDTNASAAVSASAH
jgi:hypothetical protein